MLSRKAKYGLIAMLHLARHYEQGPLLISEIAEQEELPRKFLELILLELKNAGFLDSKKGRGGGYVLAKDPAHVTVGSIVRTIDGPLAPVRCASTTAPVMCDECREPAFCAIRLVMKDTRDAMSNILDTATLRDLIQRSDEVRQSERPGMFYI